MLSPHFAGSSGEFLFAFRLLAKGQDPLTYQPYPITADSGGSWTNTHTHFMELLDQIRGAPV
jgi:hypothetical protein